MMTGLFYFADISEYSEGAGSFYIASDSIEEAKDVYRRYIYSSDYWGNNKPGDGKIERTISENLKKFQIFACPGILVSEERRGCIFRDLYTNKYDKRY